MADNEYATPLLLRTHGLSESVVPMERVCIQNKKDLKTLGVVDFLQTQVPPQQDRGTKE